MRRFSDLTDCEFMSETTDGPYCLYSEAVAEIERLKIALRDIAMLSSTQWVLHIIGAALEDDCHVRARKTALDP